MRYLAIGTFRSIWLFRVRLTTILLLLSILFAARAECAVGVYNWSFLPAEGGRPPVTISYRLNTAADVLIEILDSSNNVIHTLGPFAGEVGGLHEHQWDGSGASSSGTFKARIAATAGPVGTAPGQLIKLFGQWFSSQKYYGAAVDNNPQSPGYGTIYIPDCAAAGKPIYAYYPDFTLKWTANTGFTPSYAPWGIGVDQQGYVYVASKANGVVSGLKVFSPDGIEAANLDPGIAQANNFCGGCGGGGLPYALKSNDTPSLLGMSLNADHGAGGGTWNTVVSPGVANTRMFQFCFTPDGTTCYLALHRTSTAAHNPANKGVQKWDGSLGGSWTQDAGFDPGLDDISVPGGLTAAEFTAGVGLDSTGPNGAPKYLWIGIDKYGPEVGGNIKRLRLATGELESFTGPGYWGRFVAPDGVGNVVLDYDTAGTIKLDDKWRGWGLYAPYDQGSSDQRTTSAAMVIFEGGSPPVIQGASANPPIVAPDGVDCAILTITVSDDDGEADISYVCVDLSALGGSSSTPVTQYVSLGDGFTRDYSLEVTAQPGTALGQVSLPIVAGDNAGLTDTTSADLIVARCVDDISEAKSWANGEIIAICEAATASAVFGDCFYIMDDDRFSGMKIVSSSKPNVGQSVQVKGSLSIANGERFLENAFWY